nr:MAG TPA: hypothetical protein [Caudoviricetes sp.]
MARKCTDLLKRYQRACNRFLCWGKVIAHVLEKSVSELHPGPLNLKSEACF